jgi:hypothetical protein
LEQSPSLLGCGGQGTPGRFGLNLRLTQGGGGGLLRCVALRMGCGDLDCRRSPVCLRCLAHGLCCFLCLIGS